MEELYRLINICWKFGKQIYENKPTNMDEYKFLDRVRQGLYDEESAASAKKFIRTVTLAVIDYYEDTKNDK